MLALALIVILVALSDPFVTSTEEIAGNVDSRVRIDLVDTSLSMAWEFANSELSRAEVARDAHLEFLEMRREKMTASRSGSFRRIRTWWTTSSLTTNFISFR